METSRRNWIEGVLPHEAIFSLFLLATWLRLVPVEGPFGTHALGFLIFLEAGLALAAMGIQRPSPGVWRLRLAYYPLVTGLAYVMMREAVPKIHPATSDALLQRLDGILVGGNLSLMAERGVTPALTELMSLFYLLFIPYVLVSLVRYLFAEVHLARRFYMGLFSIYGAGFLGYSLFPAHGPYIAMAGQFTVALDGGWITQLNRDIVGARSILVDVFPSLHCAVSGYILFFERRRDPRSFRWMLLPVVGIWLSTLYLRYHYLTDVVAGLALAAVGLWLARVGGAKSDL